MQNDHSTRKCKKCNIIKDINNFVLYSENRRRHECHECYKKRHYQYYLQDKPNRLRKSREAYARDPTAVWTPERRKRANELSRKRCAELRDKVYELFGGKCICCGESEKMFMTLDHINNDGNYMRKNVHTTSSAKIYLEILRGKLKNVFQLLCMNCNFGRARNGGVCPHKEGSTTISKESRNKCSEVHRILRDDDIV